MQSFDGGGGLVHYAYGDVIGDWGGSAPVGDEVDPLAEEIFEVQGEFHEVPENRSSRRRTLMEQREHFLKPGKEDTLLFRRYRGCHTG